MKRTHLVTAAAAMVLIGSGCGDAPPVLGPETSELAARGPAPQAAAAAPASATGEFVTVINPETLTTAPAGNNCIAEDQGELVFSGTLEGVAPVRTTARVFAPCADVLANLPGTFPGVFKSVAEFEGAVNGEPAQAGLVFQGKLAVGGQIDGRIRLSGGLRGVVQVDAQLAVGGSYEGFVIVR